uniref:Activin types I and II receptor domain-containing protein n=1 Tax=Parascaris univalens TaxID=6257 RepID=A0A914ZPV7_PARUN
RTFAPYHMYSYGEWAVLIGVTIYAEHVLALICYDCYDTGPSNEGCVKTKNCTGTACLVYEGMDMATSSAFCLLLPSQSIAKRRKIERQCWLESNDPSSLPIENATLVKRNPIIEYNGDVNPVAANPVQIRNIQHSPLSSAASTTRREHAADDPGALSNDENDLVPISHDDYINDNADGNDNDKKSRGSQDDNGAHSNSIRLTNTIFDSTIAFITVINVIFLA